MWPDSWNKFRASKEALLNEVVPWCKRCPLKLKKKKKYIMPSKPHHKDQFPGYRLILALDQWVFLTEKYFDPVNGKKLKVTGCYAFLQAKQAILEMDVRKYNLKYPYYCNISAVVPVSLFVWHQCYRQTSQNWPSNWMFIKLDGFFFFSVMFVHLESL